ncbi:MAG TPA: 30S ribosomal protein S8 [Terriglobia bacterium]|nr:30S ribosomal protein S8 [Terriglobia bacterium]
MSAVTDPIADMLTRIRNGIRARHQRVDMPASNLKVGLAAILKEEGYIGSYKLNEDSKKRILRINLRYSAEGDSVISTIERVSRPGRRVYVGADEIPRILGGMGVTVLTTSQGLMTGKKARKTGLGGEVLCNIS